MSNHGATLIRDSNIELLRVVCMLMIVIGHFIRHSLLPVINDPLVSIYNKDYVYIVLFGFCYVAVNVFVLISGYYRIKFKLTSLLSLYLICSFYALVNSSFNVFYLNNPIEYKTILSIFFPFSCHERLWFINCYLILYFVSPLLNIAIENMRKNEFILILISFTILNLYFGYLRHANYFNTNGYSGMQFVYLYLIGAYISKFLSVGCLSKHKSFILSSYVMFSLIWGILTVMSHYIRIPFWDVDSYNNPVLLCSSIAFFAFFLCFRLKCSFINAIAGNVLAVYLLQDSKGLGVGFLYPQVQCICDYGGGIFGCCQYFFIFAVCIESIRRSFSLKIFRPIYSYLSKTDKTIKQQ